MLNNDIRKICGWKSSSPATEFEQIEDLPTVLWQKFLISRGQHVFVRSPYTEWKARSKPLWHLKWLTKPVYWVWANLGFLL